MKEASLTGCLGLLALFLVAGPAAGRVYAIKPFSDEFTAKYVKKERNKKKDQDFAKLVEETKCLVCHMGKSKKDRNPYGVELAKHARQQDRQGQQGKIHSALAKVRSCLKRPRQELADFSAS